MQNSVSVMPVAGTRGRSRRQLILYTLVLAGIWNLFFWSGFLMDKLSGTGSRNFLTLANFLGLAACASCALFLFRPNGPKDLWLQLGLWMLVGIGALGFVAETMTERWPLEFSKIAMTRPDYFARDDSLAAQFPSRRGYLEQLNQASDAANAAGSTPCTHSSPRTPAEIELNALLNMRHFFMVCRVTHYPGERLWDVPTGGLAGSGSVGYAFIPPLPNGEKVQPGNGIVYTHIIDSWYVYSLQ